MSLPPPSVLWSELLTRMGFACLHGRHPGKGARLDDGHWLAFWLPVDLSECMREPPDLRRLKALVCDQIVFATSEWDGPVTISPFEEVRGENMLWQTHVMLLREPEKAGIDEIQFVAAT